MTSMAGRERQLLCAELTAIGPVAPTLCGTWSSADLAAHLAVRERHPAAVGIVVGPAAAWTENVQRAYARKPFTELVELVRTGPPWWSAFSLPGADAAGNTFEMFVHHEDLRRAQSSWQPRTLVDEDEQQLWTMLTKRARLYLRRSPVSVELCWPGSATFPVTPRSAATRSTTLMSGLPSELTLYLHGRTNHADVVLHGDPDDVQALKAVNLSV